MQKNQPSLFRVLKVSAIFALLLGILLVSGIIRPRKSPTATPPPPPNLSASLAQALASPPSDLGPASVNTSANALDLERRSKIETAIVTFQKERAGGTLAPQVRRPIAIPAGHPEHDDPMNYLSEKQERALANLRLRAEKYVNVRVFPDDGSIRMLAGRRLEEPASQAEPGFSLEVTTARTFLSRNADLFGLLDPLGEFHVIKEERDEVGYTQVKLRQLWNGLEVWPCEALVQLNPHGAVDLFMGTYRPSPGIADVDPTIAVEDSRSVATAAIRMETGSLVAGTVQEEALVWFAPDRDAVPQLAWRHYVHGSILCDWNIYVDANSGAVLRASKTACTAATQGSGVDLFGQTRPLNLWQENGAFWMVDTTKQMFQPAQSTPPGTARVIGGIVIHDAQGLTEQQVNANPNSALNQIASTTANAGWRPDAVSAAFDVSKVYDHYLSRHNRNSFDASGRTITVVVNIDMANATFNWGTGTMSFGTKRLSGAPGPEYYARAFDVTAHEMSHGVIGTTAGLEYEYQSGALNEAFADILGESAEAFVYRGGSPDWLLGTNMVEQIRDMSDPGRFNQPARMSQYQQLDITQDRGGVHVNSGIPNHAFYQLAEGLNPGIGLDKAEKIFFRALTTGKLQRYSDFVDCRLACVKAAEELHGAGSIEAQKSAAAFEAVELFDQQAPPPPQPLPGTSGIDSTLFSFFWIDGFTYLGRREAAFGDDITGTFLGTILVAPYTRPAVVGDGSQAFVVLANHDAAFVDTATGGATTLNLTGQVASVAWSPDGSAYGFVFVNPVTGQRENRIDVFDSNTNEWTNFELLSPVLDGGLSDNVLFADALDFNADGTVIVYDALNRLQDSFGFFVDSYSIYFLNRASHNVSFLAPPDPSYNVGNPAFGQRHNNLLAFEAEDTFLRVSYQLTKDLAGSAFAQIGAVGSFNGPGFPGYTGNDEAIVYSDSFSGVLGIQPLSADGVTPVGAAQAWIDGHVGTIYRRGNFESMPTLNVGLSDALASESGDTAAILVTRTGGGSAAVPFSFVLTGAAANGSDFARLALNFTLPAGVESAAISFQPVDDTEVEGSESVSLTLQNGVNYRAGTKVTGTIIIADNDSAPVDDYEGWLVEHFGDTVVNNALLEVSTWGASADPDRDGLGNFVEAYFGTDPKVGSAIAYDVLRDNSGNFILSWQEADDPRGLSAVPEWSPQPNSDIWLRSGQSAPGIPPRIIIPTDLGKLPGLSGRSRRASIPGAGREELMLRLRIIKG